MSALRVLVISPVPLAPVNSGNRARIVMLVQSLARDLGAKVEVAIVQRHEDTAELTVPGFAAQAWSLNPGLRPGWRQRCRKRLLEWVKSQPLLHRRLASARNTLAAGDSNQRPLALQLPADRLQAVLASRLAEFRPTHVLFEYAYLACLCPAVPAGVVKIVDTHDRLSGRAGIMAESGMRIPLYSPGEAEERTMLQAFDRIVAIQQHEQRFFAQMTGRSVDVLLHQVEVVPPPGPAPVGAPRLLFLGSLNHVNVVSARRLVRQILPRVRALVPEVECEIAGGVSSVLESAPGLTLTARAADLGGFYHRGVALLNPVVAGTGLKIKNAEALGYGLPVVTTRTGAEGLEFAIGEGIVLGETDEELAAAAVRLVREPGAREAAGARALAAAARLNQDFHAGMRSLFSPS